MFKIQQLFCQKRVRLVTNKNCYFPRDPIALDFFKVRLIGLVDSNFFWCWCLLLFFYLSVGPCGFQLGAELHWLSRARRSPTPWNPDKRKMLLKNRIAFDRCPDRGERSLICSAHHRFSFEAIQATTEKGNGGPWPGLEVETARSKANWISSVRCRLWVEYLMPVRGASSKFNFLPWSWIRIPLFCSIALTPKSLLG